MHAVLLTEDELAHLQALVKQQGSTDKSLETALAHPVPNLVEHHWDIEEIISRARDGSSYIDEDFGDFLNVLKTAVAAHKGAVAARKAAE